MSYLYQRLATQAADWRSQHYQHDTFPAIAEIFEHAKLEDGQPRYLRNAQLQALEVYWYLRLCCATATAPDLYKALFPKPKDRLEAMGISNELFAEADYDYGELVRRIRTDLAFVRANKLESLWETLTLDYPSYIFALTMGAGKTILMGTIAATEFAMAQEYPDADFVKNALIFAPGTTIIESLRELAEVPYQNILPPRMHKRFAASVKLTFTRDGEKNLSVQPGSHWNILVTNTEKIRIQKRARNKAAHGQADWVYSNTDDQDLELANQRLMTIASLSDLAIFSDEAHHTYGQNLLGKWQQNKQTGELTFTDQGIKKVRKTVDFLAQETNLRVVVNTTGTPYYQRQPLRDVVAWYSLGEGIKDGVLKELANNIRIFDSADSDSEQLINHIVSDFIQDYWQTTLPDGSPAKLALYFPNVEAMEALRPAVESTLAQQGQSTSTVLAVHNKASKETRAEFHRLAKDPTSPYRIVLLVNMGTEGWNCPSLFACGLVRKLKTSNNFVLQAATRCLRQVPGNTTPARVYVAKSNKALLQKQLEETYGTTLDELNREQGERIEQTIEVRKPNLPPLLLKKKVLRVRRKAESNNDSQLSLRAPQHVAEPSSQVGSWTLTTNRDGKTQLKRVDGGEDTLLTQPMQFSSYGAASELASNYHLPLADVHKAVKAAYQEKDIPESHLPELGMQIEQQTANYEAHWEEIDIAVALLKTEGFDKTERNGQAHYTARISFAKERAHLYQTADDLTQPEQARQISFHYEGYNFDSNPEAHYLERVLALIHQNQHNISGIWFTGGLTDPSKTELYAEYLGSDKKWHRYTPDFVIARNDGKHLVVEIKNDQLKPAIQEDLKRAQSGEVAITPEGQKAVALQKWQDLNPDTLQYELIFADGQVPEEALAQTKAFLAQSVT